MTRQTATRWYIGAWVIWVAALLIFTLNIRTARSGGHLTVVGYPSLATAAWIAAFIAALVMLVAWLGALIRLARRRAWAWFAAVLISHLAFLGILGMVAYALGGSEEADRTLQATDGSDRPELLRAGADDHSVQSGI